MKRRVLLIVVLFLSVSPSKAQVPVDSLAKRYSTIGNNEESPVLAIVNDSDQFVLLSRWRVRDIYYTRYYDEYDSLNAFMQAVLYRPTKVGWEELSKYGIIYREDRRLERLAAEDFESFKKRFLTPLESGGDEYYNRYDRKYYRSRVEQIVKICFDHGYYIYSPGCTNHYIWRIFSSPVLLPPVDSEGLKVNDKRCYDESGESLVYLYISDEESKTIEQLPTGYSEVHKVTTYNGREHYVCNRRYGQELGVDIYDENLELWLRIPDVREATILDRRFFGLISLVGEVFPDGPRGFGFQDFSGWRLFEPRYDDRATIGDYVVVMDREEESEICNVYYKKYDYFQSGEEICFSFMIPDLSLPEGLPHSLFQILNKVFDSHEISPLFSDENQMHLFSGVWEMINLRFEAAENDFKQCIEGSDDYAEYARYNLRSLSPFLSISLQ